MAAQQQVTAAVAAVASVIERQIDAEINRLDNLGEDDLETIRKQRMVDMQRRQQKTKEWLAKGHGEYTEVATEKDFFDAMKGEERVICHFYRENWPCKVMDKHMDILAKKHIETRFVKINAEKSPFLTERLKIWMLPTLALIKSEKVEDYVVGFNDMGGTDDFPTEILEERLAKGEMIDYDWPRLAAAQQGAGSSQPRVRKGGVQRTESDEDSDFDG